MDTKLHVTRRELVIGGSAALAAMALQGCGSRQAASVLPGPRWPGEGGAVAGPALAQPGPQPFENAPPVGVTPRSEWTSAGVSSRVPINPMNGVNRITVHHDGLPPTMLRSSYDVVRRLEQIRQGHISRRPEPFADIGYHFIIDPSGRVWEGRNVRYQGAHVKENNEHNLGIMVLGNFNEQRPTPQATASLDRFLAQQMSRYNVSLSRVYTHKEIRPTECPGRSLQSYMNQTRARGGSLASLSTGTRYS